MTEYRDFTKNELKWINSFQKVMESAPNTLFLFVGAGQTIFAKDENNKVYMSKSGGVDSLANSISIKTPMEMRLLNYLIKPTPMNKQCTCAKTFNAEPLLGSYAGCPVHDPSYIDTVFMRSNNSMYLTKLTEMQKLHALAYKYYQGQKWEPNKGDYYTTSRADLELYQVVDVTDTKVITRYLVGSDNVSEWDKSGFTTEGFGVNRVWVPDFIFKLN